MLKISLVEKGHAVPKLLLEGNIAGPWVGELEEMCVELLDRGGLPELNLADVAFVDHAGLDLLARLQSDGVILMDCSPFVTEQLKQT